LGSMGGPYMVQSKNSFPPYGLPPNYTLPNVVHVPSENANHFVLILLEGQQPQLGHAPFAQPMGEAREEPRDHALGELPQSLQVVVSARDFEHHNFQLQYIFLL